MEITMQLNPFVVQITKPMVTVYIKQINHTLYPVCVFIGLTTELKSKKKSEINTQLFQKEFTYLNDLLGKI
jgi:hypothetical protein